MGARKPKNGWNFLRFSFKFRSIRYNSHRIHMDVRNSKNNQTGRFQQRWVKASGTSDGQKNDIDRGHERSVLGAYNFTGRFVSEWRLRTFSGLKKKEAIHFWIKFKKKKKNASFLRTPYFILSTYRCSRGSLYLFYLSMLPSIL